MLSNYKEKCENLVKNHIEQNTRHKLENFVLEDYQEFIANFEIEVMNEFDVAYDETTHKGSMDRGDEKYFQQAEYKSAIKRHINREFNSEENFNYMLNEIASGMYGKYDTQKGILRGDTILYEYDCPNCKGYGKVKCDRCRNGEINCTASGCKNGRVERSRQVNGQRRTYYESCSKCRGKGRIVCPKCGGSALIDCRNCDAEGILTNRAVIFVIAKPNYLVICPENMDKEIQNAVQKWSSPHLSVIANIARKSLQHSISQKIVSEIYNAKIPFAKFKVICNGKKFAWCVYGTDLQILRDSNMLNYFLQNDINSLIEVSKKASHFDTKILQKSQVAVANFMQSAINQQIIKADMTDFKAIESRVEKIENNVKDSKSLSRDYLQNTFKSLDKMAKSFCDGVTLNYFIIAFIIGFIIAFVFLKYGFLGSIAIFPLFIYLGNRYKKSAFKKWWGEILLTWAENKEFIKTRYVLYTIIGVCCVFVASYYVNLDKLLQLYNNSEISKKSYQNSIQTNTKKPKQESVEQTRVEPPRQQNAENPTKTQNTEPSILNESTPNAQNETQISSENAPKALDYEQKFGKRIYLATKDEFVNMRNAPSGEIIAQIYKKDFENIMIYSFDANSNEKWLKVMYFPPNVKDEQNAISGYIHISQIDKNRF